MRPEPADAAGEPPVGGQTGWSSQASGMLCSSYFFRAKPRDAGADSLPDFVSSDVLILFDGSESTGIAYRNGTRASAMADAIKSVVDTYQRRIAFGLLRFPDPASCGTGQASGCCVGEPVVEVGLGQGTAIRNALNNRPTPQGSAPLARALQMAAGVFQRIPTQGENRLVLLATDGQPGCGLGPGDAAVSSNGCDEAGRALQDLANLDPPVRTLVLSPGPGDLDDQTDCLRSLASKEIRFGDASMTSNWFITDDLASLKNELESTFVSAETVKPSCTLVLSPDPAPGGRVSVLIDGQKIPEDSRYGWTVVVDDLILGGGAKRLRATVTLNGEYCERLRQFRYDTVEVRYGCPIAQLEKKRRSGYFKT